MKLPYFLAISFAFFVGTTRAQGVVSAKSPAVRINTLPFFEAKAPVRVSTPEVVKGRTIWRETFADNQHNWKTGKGKTGTFILANDGYQIQTDSRDIEASSLIDTPFDFNGNDFTVEVTFVNTGDNPPNAGLLVGGEEDRFFMLRINHLSRFIAQYITADKKAYSADDFIFNANIASGTNKLKITKTDKTMDFYINDEKVYTRLFQPLGSQQIGVIGSGHNVTVKSVLLIGATK